MNFRQYAYYDYAGKVFPTVTGRFTAYDNCGNMQHFDTVEAANIFSRQGTPIEYRGYTIAPGTFYIFRNGVRMFTAWWLKPETLEMAKAMIDDALEPKVQQLKYITRKAEPDNYERFQLERYGNILPMPYVTLSGDPEEATEEQHERAREWMEVQYNHQLNDAQ